MRFITSACASILLALSGGALAQPEGKPKYEAGSQYRELSESQSSGDGKTEVIEFFSYSCPHCNSFHPIIKDWKSSVGDDVEVRHVPVIFRPGVSEVHARAYYVAKSLDALDKTHGAMFEAIHGKRMPLKKPADVADLYADLGLDREEVMDAFDSFVVDMKVKRAKKMIRAYGVQRTPSMAVAGRYVTSPSKAGGQQKMLSVVEYLLEEKVGSGQGDR